MPQRLGRKDGRTDVPMSGKSGTGERAHEWAHILRAELALLDDAGRPVVLAVEKPLAPHGARLMDALGVKVEVVSPTVRDHRSDVASGMAAQDYRASLARIARRRQAGEDARGCASCGTEIDVEAPAHDARCNATARVVAAAEAERSGGGSDGVAAAKMEKGRDGKTRSTAERSADGSLTKGELQRRHDADMDAAPMVVRCAECDWRFEGSAADGRDAARAHREHEHPDLGRVKRRPALKPGQSVSQVRPDVVSPELDIGLDKTEVDSAPGPAVEPTAVSPEPDTPSDVAEASTTKKRIGRPPTWTAEKAIAFLRERATDGVAPSIKLVEKAGLSWTPIKRLFGTYAAFCAAADLHAPARGGPRKNGQFDASGSAASTEEPKPEAPQDLGREPLDPEEPEPIPPEPPPAPHAVTPDSPRPLLIDSEPGSRPEELLPALSETETASATAKPKASVSPSATADPPPPGWSFALTGDFQRDAQRCRQEAAVLRHQAAALDVIATGIEMLGEDI